VAEQLCNRLQLKLFFAKEKLQDQKKADSSFAQLDTGQRGCDSLPPLNFLLVKLAKKVQSKNDVLTTPKEKNFNQKKEKSFNKKRRSENLQKGNLGRTQ